MSSTLAHIDFVPVLKKMDYFPICCMGDIHIQDKQMKNARNANDKPESKGKEAKSKDKNVVSILEN